MSSGIDIAAALIAGKRFRPLSQGMRQGYASAAPGETVSELPILNPYVAPGVRDRIACGSVTSDVGSTRPMPVGRPASATSPANLAEIDLFECDEVGNPDVMAFMAGLDFDIACVACWHRPIPSRVLDLPRHGFLNVHPSLLPAYRGPDPLFWQFRAGETRTGVTVHWMDSGLDTGDIAAQRTVRFADGIRASEAEAMCASAGGWLLAKALNALERGRLERLPQPSGSYFPAPSLDDFAVDTDWPVRRAFNFVRAAAEYGFPFHVVVDGKKQWFGDAIGWHDSDASVPEMDGRVGVHFRDGVLWVQERPGPMS